MEALTALPKTVCVPPIVAWVSVPPAMMVCEPAETKVPLVAPPDLDDLEA